MMNLPQKWQDQPALKGWNLLDHDAISNDESSCGGIYRIVSIETGEVAQLKWVRAMADSRRQVKKLHKSVAAEVEVLYSLNDVPQIVHIQDYAIIDNGDEACVDVLLRMEQLQSLRVDKEQLSSSEMVKLAVDLSDALKQLHSRKLVHNDIRPETIVYGDGYYKLNATSCFPHLFNEQSVSSEGNLCYRAPEYRKKRAKLSPQGDIYALGMIFYVLFNDKRLPYQQEGATQLETYAALKEAFDDRERYFPAPSDAPIAVAKVIAKATAIRPKDRYQRVEVFMRAFCQALTTEHSFSAWEEANRKKKHVDDMNASIAGLIHQVGQQSREVEKGVSSTCSRVRVVSWCTVAIMIIYTVAALCVFVKGYVLVDTKAFAAESEEVSIQKKKVHDLVVFGVSSLLESASGGRVVVSSVGYTEVILQTKQEEKNAKIRYYISGQSGRYTEKDIDSWPVYIENLVPGTAYEADIETADGMTHVCFTTEAVKESRNISKRYQGLYAGSRSEIRQYLAKGVSRDEMLLNGVYRQIKTPWSIPLKNGSMEYQDEEYMLYAEFTYSGDATEEDVCTGLVLRTDNKETYAIQKQEEHIPSDSLVKIYFTLDELLTQRYVDKGKLYFGDAILEMYCGDELVANGRVNIWEE